MLQSANFERPNAYANLVCIDTVTCSNLAFQLKFAISVSSLLCAIVAQRLLVCYEQYNHSISEHLTQTHNPQELRTFGVNMAFTSAVLPALIGLFMLDGLIEMGLIASMVRWLHISNHDIPYEIRTSTGDYALFPKPKHMLVDQGHTSNGAAGTAVVLIGFGGIIVLYLLRRGSTAARGLFTAWFVFLVLETLLCFAALVYTFVLTYSTTAHQTIDQAYAASLHGKPYLQDTWTPETWYKQVLALNLSYDSDRSNIQLYVHIMEGWKWNLIPLCIIALALTAVAAVRLREVRKSQYRSVKVQSREIGKGYGYEPYGSA